MTSEIPANTRLHRLLRLREKGLKAIEWTLRNLGNVANPATLGITARRMSVMRRGVGAGVISNRDVDKLGAMVFPK